MLHVDDPSLQIYGEGKVEDVNVDGDLSLQAVAELALKIHKTENHFRLETKFVMKNAVFHDFSVWRNLSSSTKQDDEHVHVCKCNGNCLNE